jgi:hypothetical protein
MVSLVIEAADMNCSGRRQRVSHLEFGQGAAQGILSAVCLTVSN